MRILLVAPGSENDIDNRLVREVPYLRSRALFGPHAVVTVAALTPKEHDVVVHDEHVRGPVEPLLDCEAFDIVGVSLTTNQYNRALQIARHCRQRTPCPTTVAGGIGAQNLMHVADKPFDVVIYGEAEGTWPQFLSDYQRHSHSPVYTRYSHPDLTKAPVPRWDLIAADIPSYGTLSVQTTRGCPHDCAFCDVIYTYGRTPRSKSIGQVLEEIRMLERLGAEMIFIADDNFGGGNRQYTKRLLRGMVRLNNSFATPLIFMTQVDILVSRDEELLGLLADANFADLMIGIESVSDAALRDMNKLQNLKVDPLEAVRRIQSYGIAVLGHMIIGNDSDDTTSFGGTARFVEDANILHHFCHPLMAPPGTRLWHQLAREGRLVALDDTMRDRLDIVPNIVPKRMSRSDLLTGLADYWESVNHPANYTRRALGFIDGVVRRPNVKRPAITSAGKLLRLLAGIFRYFLFSAPRGHRRAFFRILRAASRRAQWLVPRMVFLYTCYLMDYKRAGRDAAVARDQAEWERQHPNQLRVEERYIPLSEEVRSQAPDIVSVAYAMVRTRTAENEVAYRIVVDTLIDYSDRFGSLQGTSKALVRQQAETCCERILATSSTQGHGGEAGLPQDPPTGFVREILDAADNTLRVRALARHDRDVL